MPITDYNKKKQLNVDSVTGTPSIGKAQPVLIKGTTTGSRTVNNSSNNTTSFAGDNSDLLLNSRGIVTIAGFECDSSADVTVIVKDSSDNILASKTISASAGVWETITFTESDYSRIPESGETITLRYETTSGLIERDNNYTNNGDHLFEFVNDLFFVANNSSGGGTGIKFETRRTESKTGNGDIILDFTNISDAQDIAVYDQNGNLLDYEIEDLDTTAETATLWCYNSWVRDGSTQAQIAYGSNSANVDRQNVTGTWSNTGQNAVMVQHLQESSPPFLDSTSNNNDSTSVTGTTATSGQFDGARSFDGADDQIRIGTSPGTGQTSGTITFWHNSDNSAGDGAAHSWYDSDTTNGELNFQKFQNNQVYAGWRTDSSSRVVVDVSAPLWGAGEWNIQTLRWNSSQTDYVFNATQQGTIAQSDSESAASDLYIGSSATDFDYFDVSMDAFRIYSDYKDDTWLQADYDASPKAGQVFFSQQAAEDTVTTQEETFSQDVSIKNEDVTKQFSQTVILENRNIPEQFTQDVAVSDKDVEKTLDTDVTVQDRDVEKTFTQDVTLFDRDVEKTFNQDVSIASLDQEENFSQDVIISEGNEAPFSQDVSVKELDREKQFSQDLIIENENVPEQFSQDVNIADLNVEQNFSQDLVIANLDQEATFSQDVLVADQMTETFDNSVVIAKQPAPNVRNPLTLDVVQGSETFTKVLNPTNTYLNVEEVKKN